MTNFDLSYINTNQIEGGYSDNPNDAGGETYRGISRKNWPKWSGWEIIDAAKKLKDYPKVLDSNEGLQSAIKMFYEENFWNAIQGNKFIYLDIAKEVYDNAVNMGVETSIKYLQRSLNVLNRNATKYDDIVVDGNVGKATFMAIDQCVKVNGVKRLVNVINAFQVKHYLERMENNKTQEEFVGWLNRVTINWA